MSIILPLVSILAIALIAYAVSRLQPFQICPICAGVAGTWILMLSARALGYAVSAPVLAMLIGGSVVGLAYQFEKRLPKRSARLFKALFIPAGFAAGYGIVLENWLLALIAVIVLIAIVGAFLLSGSPASGDTRGLLRDLADCCND